MTRESVTEKSLRLIAAGAVTITRVQGATVDATVLGDTSTYEITRRRGGWRCTCPAAIHNRRCAHLAAIQLITKGDPS